MSKSECDNLKNERYVVIAESEACLMIDLSSIAMFFGNQNYNWKTQKVVIPEIDAYW